MISLAPGSAITMDRAYNVLDWRGERHLAGADITTFGRDVARQDLLLPDPGFQ